MCHAVHKLWLHVCMESDSLHRKSDILCKESDSLHRKCHSKHRKLHSKHKKSDNLHTCSHNLHSAGRIVLTFLAEVMSQNHIYSRVCIDIQYYNEMPYS